MTAGESHGPALLATIEGLPSGLRITTDDLRRVLARRRLGYGRGARQKFEADEVSILAGVRHGVNDQDCGVVSPVALSPGSVPSMSITKHRVSSPAARSGGIVIAKREPTF